MVEHLLSQKIRCYVLGGDKPREGINHNLGFSESNKGENIRIVAEIARLMNDSGLWVIAVLISPKRLLEKMREVLSMISFLRKFTSIHLF